jgi:hypothetical protein
MVSKELESDSCEGSLVLYNSSKIFLRHLNPSSVSMFIFFCCGLGFVVPSSGCVGLWFSPGPY